MLPDFHSENVTFFLELCSKNYFKEETLLPLFKECLLMIMSREVRIPCVDFSEIMYCTVYTYELKDLIALSPCKYDYMYV